MNQFDKICAVLAIPIGIVFMFLGIFGLFTGSNANFTLPPVIGALPFFLGWAMCVTLIRFWRATNRLEESDPTDGREVRSVLFHEFIARHPEFEGAHSRLQWNAFHKWLDHRNDP